MSNFWQRILTAAVAVPILYGIFRIGGVIYLLFIMALILFGQIEFQKLLRSRNFPDEKISGIAFSLLLALSAYLGYLYFMMTFTGAVVLILVFELWKLREGGTIQRAGVTLFGVIYIGWLLSHAILLRDIGHVGTVREFASSVQGLKDPGFFYIFFFQSPFGPFNNSLCILIKICDICIAYYSIIVVSCNNNICFCRNGTSHFSTIIFDRFL